VLPVNPEKAKQLLADIYPAEPNDPLDDLFRPVESPTQKERAAVAEAAVPDEIDDDDPDPRRDPDFDRNDPVCRSVLAEWLKRQAEKQLSDPEATMACLLGAAKAAAGVKPKPAPKGKAKAAEPESKVQWSQVDADEWTAEHNGYTFEIRKETFGGKGFLMSFKTPAGEVYGVKARRTSRPILGSRTSESAQSRRGPYLQKSLNGAALNCV
jgi:hypothetical protein